MLGQLGYGFAYRICDAQFHGVAQRRRRVFAVGCLGDWRSAAAVLFEQHSLSGHPAPSRKARQVAPTIPSRSTAGGGLGTDFDCDGGLIPALSMCLATGTGQRYDAETETILPVLPFDTTQITSAAKYSNPKAGALAAETGAKQQCYVALGVALRGREGGATAELGDEVGGCLRPSSGGGDKPHVLTAMQVRRLTPTECERLQGFPDNFTQIPWRKKAAADCPDGPRYKALGNSWAVPVAAWIGKRIMEVEAA